MKKDYTSPEFGVMNLRITELMSTSTADEGPGIIGSDDTGGAQDTLG